jgi:hypothetical protein
MSRSLDSRLQHTGTRFRIFPQPRFLQKNDGSGRLFPDPEVVFVSVSPEQMLPGPADDRMYVVDAVGKLPYNQLSGPPYRGEARRTSAAGGGRKLLASGS